MKILLAITFVFGVLQFLSVLKVFNISLSLITRAIIPHNEKTLFGKFMEILGVWFFYFSLCFQAWYWLFK
jgi:hypothetical protein